MEYNWDVTSDQDWIDYLLKSVIKGTGFPTNYIDESQNVDFARTVVMQNQFLVRKIVNDQEYFQKSMTEFIKKLYYNEFKINNENDSNEEKEEIGSFDEIYNAIEVVYPTPVTLNLTNINEQISNATQAADFIISNYIDDQDTMNMDLPKLKMKFKKKISRELIPSLDWDSYDDMFKECEKELTEEKIKERTKANDGSGDDDGMDDDIDML